MPERKIQTPKIRREDAPSHTREMFQRTSDSRLGNEVVVVIWKVFRNQLKVTSNPQKERLTNDVR